MHLVHKMRAIATVAWSACLCVCW